MNEWMDEYVKDWISDCVNQWRNRWVNEQVDEWMGQQANVRENERMCEWSKNFHSLKVIWQDMSKRPVLPTVLRFMGV